MGVNSPGELLKTGDAAAEAFRGIGEASLNRIDWGTHGLDIAVQSMEAEEARRNPSAYRQEAHDLSVIADRAARSAITGVRPDGARPETDIQQTSLNRAQTAVQDAMPATASQIASADQELAYAQEVVNGLPGAAEIDAQMGLLPDNQAALNNFIGAGE